MAESINLTAMAEPYSIYLPSVQPYSATRIVGEDHKLREGKLPCGLHAADLNFLDPDNRYWHYKWCLATAGHFKDERKENAITNKHQKTCIVGDSGGFQIGKGTLDDIKTWKRHSNDPQRIMSLWRSSDVKNDIVRWLDANCDWAMTIDIPIWTIQERASPFRNLTTAQLTELSEENLRFISDKRGAFGSCRYLNVLQGKSEEEEQHWFDAVSKYKFDGWSFAGHVGQVGGIYRVLRRLMLLRDKKMLDKGYDWLHILRLSRMRWTPIMTAIQQQIRKTINPNFTISYDSSSPYQVGGVASKFATMNSFGKNLNKDWSIPIKRFPTGYDAANALNAMRLDRTHEHFLTHPMESPIARLLTIQQMNVKTGDMDIKTTDTFADEVLLNHNLYIFCLANIKANEAVFKTQTAPDEIMEAVGAIEEIFTATSWKRALNKHRELLARVVGDKI